MDYVINDHEINVPVVTLDSYCKEENITEIDFIKIDVEGFEKEVFDGAPNILCKIKPKFIQMEFNWHQLFKNASLYLFSEYLVDYDVYQLIYKGWVKRDPKDPLCNIYSYSNFIFVRRDVK